MRPLNLLPLLLLAVASLPGCIGNIRDTTTVRTAHEILLISTAAQRAVREYDATPLARRRVFVDMRYFDSIDKSYVESSLRQHLADNRAVLVDQSAAADLVLEVRNGTLGIWDGDFVLGIPQLPVSYPGAPGAILLPPLYAFRRLSHQGYAKFQLWLFEPKTLAFLGRSQDLWGSAYYNQWWLLGIGPFDSSNDIFPDFDPDEVSEGFGETGDQGAEFRRGVLPPEQPVPPGTPPPGAVRPAGDAPPAPQDERPREEQPREERPREAPPERSDEQE